MPTSCMASSPCAPSPPGERAGVRGDARLLPTTRACYKPSKCSIGPASPRGRAAMPTARVNGVELYYEETGSGFPLIWSHEFAGDYRSWEPQVRYFARRYRVITYNHRGYPPSSVPTDPAAYRNEHLVEDLAALMRHLRIARAHVGGLSMGGNVALNFGIAHPDMAARLVIAACGSGTVNPEAARAESERVAAIFEARGGPGAAEHFAGLASRRGFTDQDPRGWAAFLAHVR